MACNGVAPSQRGTAVHSTNRASPALSDGTVSNPPSVVTENGTGVTSDDSMGDNSFESPLDFSLKKNRPVDADVSSYGSAESRSPVFSSAENLPHLDHQANGTAISGADGLLAHRTKIGEPQLAMPGTFPGVTLADYSAGLMPGFPAGFLPTAYGGLPSQKESRRSKTSRPFKAYPKDPLSMPLGYYGMGGGMYPGMPPIDFASAAQAVGLNTEDLFNNYRNYIMNLQADQTTSLKGRPMNGDSDGVKSEDDNRTSTPMSPDGVTAATATSSQLSPNMSPESHSNSRKRASMLPDDQKDALYWERRRKNNEAAKRSRDARRAKEDEIAIRAAYLEQENLRLKVEVAALRNETAKLRCMLYNS